MTPGQVVWVDLRGVIGINALQLGVQRCATLGVGPGLQAGADSRVDFFRGKVHAVQKAGDIESCAPHNDGSLPRAVSSESTDRRRR